MRVFLVIILSCFILYGCEKKDPQVINHDTIIKNPFPESEYEKGVRNLHEGHLDMAISHFQKQIELEAMDFRTYVVLASIYIKDKNYQKAKTLLEKAVQLKTRMPDVYFLLSQCYSQSGDTQKAIDTIKIAIDIYSKNRNGTKYLNSIKILNTLNKHK